LAALSRWRIAAVALVHVLIAASRIGIVAQCFRIAAMERLNYFHLCVRLDSSTQ
jgi:hypothetical protein